ncbi:MAG: DUF5916 domain-containing protein [Flavisolibacter sp.]
MLRTLLLFALCFCFFPAFSQVKTIQAIKAIGIPKIDGKIDDEAWKLAPLATDFIQNFPTFGIPATVKTEVRILYDNNAVYIAAHLFDDPSLIRTQITSRDGEQRQDVDYFSVFFDTYNDQQNGFQFLVTSANVQSDARIGGTTGNERFGNFGDKTWDAVWESQVQSTADGWTAELRIPYISLRFSKKEIQTWGLQFLRFIRRSNESSYWNPIDPTINGFANQFGKYLDLKNIEPPLRLSFSPYLSGGIRINPEGSEIEKQWLRSGGMDVKYGINESFTLDATLIPDFGQVVSDNIINNLSPFEVRFQENRPFFTEGTELFNKSGLFYSRRVGDIPGGYNSVQSLVANNPDLELIKNPSITQLYNGIKFSGRTKKKLGIGIFNALTAPMKANVRNISTSKDTLIITEPLSNYNIIVLDQALKGRSSITFTNTNVIRDGAARDANVSAFDWSLYTKSNNYQLRGTARYSTIFGYTPYNDEINMIYDTITRNGSLQIKPYDGYNTTIQFLKVSGNLRYFIANNITSHTYDPNDLGYIETANKVNYSGGISYQQFTPTDKFINYTYSLEVNSQYLYKPYRYSETEVSASAYWLFKNFWDVSFTASSYPTKQNDFFELRTPGMFVQKPAELTFDVNGSTDSRKRLFYSFAAGYSLRELDNNSYNRIQSGLRYRFSDQFTLGIDVFRQHENNQIGFAFIREADGNPIVGYRDFTEISNILTGEYNFTPRLNLKLRGRHYWNKVIYNRFFNVDMNGKLTERGFIAGRDENYNAFNLDAFLTWDFRLGSRVIFGWKNWLGDSYGIDGNDNPEYIKNFGSLFRESHGNEITMKIIYFLDSNQFRKKKN